MRKIILVLLTLNLFFLLPQKTFASSQNCSISLSQSSVVSGTSVTASYSGRGTTGNSVDLYVERWPDGGTINPTPGTVSVSQNVNYYKIGSCTNDGHTCQTTIPGNLASGNYYVNCNVFPGHDACSGNPFCSYENVGGKADCAALGFQSCSTSDKTTLNISPAGQPAKFGQQEVFGLSSTNQIAYFQGDLKSGIQTGPLPSSIVFSGNSVTLKDQRTGIVIANPLQNDPFYKVEVTLSETNQQNLIGYLTMIDDWWSNQYTTHGLSAGIDTNKSPSTYWWWHTDFKTPPQISQDQYDWSMRALNKFVKRQTGDVKIEIYVTPNGTYPVINGANFASFPDLYIGSYIYRNPAPLKYIVLNKYNDGGDSVTFKDLKITRLDNSLISVEDVNAYFIKQAVESNVFLQLLNNSASFNGINGFQNALWVAFLYRGYDYYFGTNHRTEVQQMTDKFLDYLPTYVNDTINSYNTRVCITQYPMGWNEAKCTNHQYINAIQATPFIFYAISDYLRNDQIATAKQQFASLIDAAMNSIKSDGSFPDNGSVYIGNNASDEVEWLTVLFAGYYANFPNDHPRADKALDYLKFTSFLVLSDGKSMRQVYGDSIKFNYLNDSFRDFTAQYIWPTGEGDHHWFHPSLNYSQGFVGELAVTRNFFDKIGLDIPTLTHNLDLVYNKSVKENLNIQTFHLNHPNPKYDPNRLNNPPQIEQDTYTYNPDGSIAYFEGRTSPSLVEDWGNIYTNYHIIENYGDYTTADQFAKNIYYSFYSGSGKLFCDGSKCEASTSKFYNYFFSDPLFAMLFSKRSGFLTATRPTLPGDLNHDGKVNMDDYTQFISSGNINIFDYNNLISNFGK